MISIVAPLGEKARALLDEAKKLAAGKDIYEKRVALITDTFDLLESFIAMMDAGVCQRSPVAIRRASMS